jgi:hypothetical protein
MSLYNTLATYALAASVFVLPVAIAASQNDRQKIGGYSVTAGKITEGHFPSATTWEDTDGDGRFDKKTLTILTGRRALITVDQPFKESDRKLTDDLVARL